MSKLAITDNGVFVTGSKAFLTVDGVHRKVLKMYRTTDGVHRLCFSGSSFVETMVISYSGNMTDQIVTMADGQYRLLTLTSSGTLTVDQEATADVWMCNGGTGGAEYSYDAVGGGGGYIASASLVLPLSSVATVGSGGAGCNWGGRTMFNDIKPASQSSRNAPDGASGGGGAHYYTEGGTGSGETTYPFGDTVYFANKPHSAGGGGGGAFLEDYGYVYHGGDGGSNGSNGGESTRDPIAQAQGAIGGASGSYGGGAGGDGQGGSASNGENASFYGSGGGGGGHAQDSSNEANGDGGSGYQGVIYVRIPLNQ